MDDLQWLKWNQCWTWDMRAWMENYFNSTQYMCMFVKCRNVPTKLKCNILDVNNANIDNFYWFQMNHFRSSMVNVQCWIQKDFREGDFYIIETKKHLSFSEVSIVIPIVLHLWKDPPLLLIEIGVYYSGIAQIRPLKELSKQNQCRICDRPSDMKLYSSNCGHLFHVVEICTLNLHSQ